jgi:hypothetical protein
MKLQESKVSYNSIKKCRSLSDFFSNDDKKEDAKVE